MKAKFLTAAMLMIIVAMSAAWGQSTRVTNSARTTPIASDIDVDQLTAQELRNKPVYDGKSEKIATVSEVTGTPGQMRQAILYTGGVLGVGGKEVALPLEKLSVATDGRLVLTMTHDQLKLLPKYR
jgi:PRC-barrel domain protein